MGEGQFGGDGSVKWEIENANDDKAQFHHDPPNGHPERKVRGVDKKYGPDFVVSLKPPKGTSADDFKKDLENGGLTIVDGRVVLRIPIEKEKRQVVVSWPEAPKATAR
jgi:hypothetical protein